tara:strand:+ start:65 stop:199 length:135 start_codon:yes stop_codon:yes gene_type:complete
MHGKLDPEERVLNRVDEKTNDGKDGSTKSEELLQLPSDQDKPSG